MSWLLSLPQNWFSVSAGLNFASLQLIEKSNSILVDCCVALLKLVLSWIVLYLHWCNTLGLLQSVIPCWVIPLLHYRGRWYLAVISVCTRLVVPLLSSQRGVCLRRVVLIVARYLNEPFLRVCHIWICLLFAGNLTLTNTVAVTLEMLIGVQCALRTAVCTPCYSYECVVV